MSNQLQLAGAQSSAPTKYAAIYNPRWSSGIWTNRSPLRDAQTSRQTEKYYGPAGDALIAGQNVEISEKLTLIRRPGNSIYGSDIWNSVDRMYDFRLSSTYALTPEQITLMVDQPDGLYTLNAPQNPGKSLVWTKSPGAGQTYMQSVGNTLFFGNGVDNKKYLQTLGITNSSAVSTGGWQPNIALNTSTGLYPFLTTFIIDPNGYIQQLTGTALPVAYVYVQADVAQLFFNILVGGVVSAGDQITFPSGMTASFLDGQTVTILQAAGNQLTFNFTTADYAQTPETGIYATVFPGDGTPTTGSSKPMWSLTVPNAGNDYQGGTTIDGTAVWTNRGNPVENWGIQPPTTPMSPTVVGAASGWAATTFYSLSGCIIDSNLNLQQVTRAGTSGASAPNWSTTFGTTLDGTPGTGVQWTMIESAAQMSWQAAKFYPAGYFLRETVSGTDYIFQSGKPTQPYISGTVSAAIWNAPHSGTVGQWDGVHPYHGTSNPSGLPYPTALGSAAASVSNLTGFDFSISTGSGGSFSWNVINASGETITTTNPFPGFNENIYLIVTATLEVPEPGNYTFSVTHGDGFQMGIGGGATFVSGTAPVDLSGAVTSVNGYPVLPAGHNQNVTANSGNAWIDTYVINFPTAGTYPIEGNLARWDKANAGLSITCNGNVICSGQSAGGGTSGSTEPTWPVFTTSLKPGYANVTESNGQLQWNNIGPTTDFVWTASTKFTTANTTIVDGNDNVEAPFRQGVSGSTSPSFSTMLYDLTTDNPNLIWLNLGPNQSNPGGGTLTVSNGGWKYAVSLVNTLDNTVSNASPISLATGNFTDGSYVQIAPGDGLQNFLVGTNQWNLDPQSDCVAIWRTTDGQDTLFLVPSTSTDYNAPITLTLADYLANGFRDMTLDIGLNNLISAPVLGENTPPAPGAINLVYYLGRLFYSINATSSWTTGPSTPAGNGLNGSAPLNYDQQASLVSRMVPTTSGLVTFTVSDINLIRAPQQLSDGSVGPILPAVPLLEGIGLLSYNALDVNGSIIGFFSTDHQFIIIDPSAGISSAGYPIGDQLRLNNGLIGQSWNPASVYVAWHVNGEDQAWYVGDGAQGWFRLMTTPAPESGNTWAPYANIVSGVKALQSIEVTPGNHQLMLGPVGPGNILYRDLDTNLDGLAPYPADAVLGSCVLAQPGQYAVVPFITTESVGTGVPLVIGVLIDEALPYYKGPFEILKRWVNDPPNLKPSKSIPAQRFYLSDDTLSAAMRSMQIQISWPPQNSPSELLTLTIFGGFISEQ